MHAPMLPPTCPGALAAAKNKGAQPGYNHKGPIERGQPDSYLDFHQSGQGACQSSLLVVSQGRQSKMVSDAAKKRLEDKKAKRLNKKAGVSERTLASE